MTHSLMLKRHEFDEGGVFEVPSGSTIRQILDKVADGVSIVEALEVRVGGYLVPEVMWERLRPKSGIPIVITRMELAGGNLGGILRAAALIAVAFVAPIVGAWAAGAAGFGAATAWAGAFTILGGIAINALIPMPTPGGSANMGADRQWNQLTGSSNQINPWGPIPIVLGESRFFPPHAALPYSENLGSDSFQYCMFDLGYGDLDISDIRIGNNPLSTYTNVQYEINKNPTIYTSDVAEAAVNFALTDNGDNATRTTSPGIDSVSLDLLFQAGLVGYGTSGKDFEMWVLYRVQYRTAGTSTWINPTSPRLSSMVSNWISGGGGQRPTQPPAPGYFMVKTKNKNPFSAGLAWDVPNGQYEVRVERIQALRGNSANTYIDGATWSVLRSIKAVNPSTTGTTKLTMRIKATDQVTGTLQTLSLMSKQKIRVYDRNTQTWSAPQLNLNPAWVAYWLITECEALSRKIPANRIDLDSFANFAEFCAANQLETRDCQDAATTAGELLKKVLANALGSIGHRDGKYSVVFDPGIVTYTRFAFSPLDITSFSVNRVFNKLPHALRVQFKNPDADWQEDEVIVLRDGYSYRGVDARGNVSTAPQATLFETMRLEQSMQSDQAWRIGRYQLAQAVYRPTTYSWSTGDTGIITTRGDVVDVAHDIAEWGPLTEDGQPKDKGWGRVVVISDQAPSGYAATIKLDTEIHTTANGVYSLQIRKAFGDMQVIDCTPHSIRTDTFYLPSMPSGVSFGDAVILGTRGQSTKRILVTGVKYARDYAASFTGVDYDERVTEYWSNPPTSIISEVSGRDYGVPDPPIITAAVSSIANDQSNDAGIATPVIRVGVSPKNGYKPVHAN